MNLSTNASAFRLDTDGTDTLALDKISDGFVEHLCYFLANVDNLKLSHISDLTSWSEYVIPKGIAIKLGFRQKS